MYDTVYEAIRSTRYLSIFCLMAVFPNETVMPLVGLAASQGHISLPWAVAAGAAGSTLGSSVVYFLARQINDDTVGRIIDRYGRWVGITTKSTASAGRWFDRHSAAAVFFGRFIPGIRTAVSVPAGLRRMPYLHFGLWTALGSGISSAFLAYLGYTAGPRYEEIGALITSVSSLVYLALMAAVIIFLFWRLHLRR